MAFDATIKEYLKEINESPLLNWEEEKDLAYRVIDRRLQIIEGDWFCQVDRRSSFHTLLNIRGQRFSGNDDNRYIR